jgi:signal transduction histidine kinase
MKNFSRDKLIFEKKIFSTVVLITLSAILAAVGMEAFWGKRMPVLILDSIMAISCLVILARNQRFGYSTSWTLAFLGIITMLCVLVYFQSGGSEGAMGNSLMAVMIVAIVILDIKYSYKVLMLFMLLQFLLLLSNIMTPNLIDGKPVGVDPLKVSAVVNVLIAGGLGILVTYLKSAYKRESRLLRQLNSELTEKNEEIEIQNERLYQQQEEIRLINESLEERIQERTQKLKKLNRKLEKYAFINSHILRAPICRIKGLYYLLEIDPRYHTTGSDEIIRHLKSAGSELDKVMEQINTALERNDREII